MINQTLKLMILLIVGISAGTCWAQQNVELEQIRWKSESQVRSLLGDPINIHGPIGTHASYTLWKYDGFTVAFANKRAFHLFNEDSLKKIELIENRDDQ